MMADTTFPADLIMMSIPAMIVVARVVCLSSRLDLDSFDGHVLQFLALSFGHACLGGGAVAALIMPAWAPSLLLSGAALMILADRRGAPWV